jgi:hypothetical protein
LIQVAATLDAEVAAMQGVIREQQMQINGIAKRSTRRTAQNRGQGR